MKGHKKAWVNFCVQQDCRSSQGTHNNILKTRFAKCILYFVLFSSKSSFPSLVVSYLFIVQDRVYSISSFCQCMKTLVDTFARINASYTIVHHPRHILYSSTFVLALSVPDIMLNILFCYFSSFYKMSFVLVLLWFVIYLHFIKCHLRVSCYVLLFILYLMVTA